MQARLAELLDHLEAERAALDAAVHAVPAVERERRPAPECWTVAEVVDHLARVEKGVARLVVKLAAEGRAAGLGPETETGSVLGALDGRGIEVPSSPRVAPERVQPRADVEASTALAALRETRVELRDALTAADGLALGALRWPHPVLGELDLYQWVLFVARHEQRHRRQIDAIAARLASTPADTAAGAAS